MARNMTTVARCPLPRTDKGVSAYRVDFEVCYILLVVGPWTPEARPRSVWKAAIGVRRRLKRKANSSR